MQRDCYHEIIVDRAAAQAFPLFTPKGEEDWVPGWAPTYLWPETGETCQEMVFTTEKDGETSVWTCLSWQPEQFHARYLRVTPGSLVAFVDVRCQPEGAARTRVGVAYQIVALSDHGRSYLEDLTDSAFAESIDTWSEWINGMGR